MAKQQMTDLQNDYGAIRTEMVALLEATQSASARSINALMPATYWEIGRRIVQSEQRGERRAEYGELLIRRMADDLTQRFGRGFGWRNLTQMRAFYIAWPAAEILQTPSAKSSSISELAAKFPLPWSAYVRLSSVKSIAARSFYETEALRSGWSVHQLDRQIGTQFYERVALSQNKAAMLEKAEVSEAKDALTPEEAIKDPFVLELLDLKDEYSESDLEAALVENLTDFLLELGDDFAFLGRQKRLRIDDTWFRIDLIFFHRRVLSLIDSQGQDIDGFLRLNEIYNMNFPADLVVLSACETGLGKQINGEGLVGLVRGFMYAGSARVVASLWKVDDSATADLMTRFYEKMLKNGESVPAALRHAQVEMSQQERWTSPYFWAGFEMQGEWRK